MATGFIAAGDWFSWNNEGAGLAVADISGNGRPDLVVFQIDAPEGANQGFYRIGWDVDAAGQVTGGWGPWLAVPDWFSWENQGADIAVADLDGDGRPELIVFQIDNPVGQNQGFYRVGWKLDTNGNVTGGWGPWEPVPDWFCWENQGAGIALGDLRASGQTDLLVFQVDAPPGREPRLLSHRLGRRWRRQGQGRLESVDGAAGLVLLGEPGRRRRARRYRRRRPLRTRRLSDRCAGRKQQGLLQRRLGSRMLNGKVSGWSPWVDIPDWFSWENQGGGLALASFDGAARPQLILLQVDNPPQQNQGYYRVLDLEVDLDQALPIGVWRLLPDITQVLPIHGGLLHTDKILFFAGSSNNPNRAGGDFRSTVWDYIDGTLHASRRRRSISSAPAIRSWPTAGMLVAGGTKEYDFGHPFFGLRDAFVFDPATEQWQRVPSMAGGRWYPTLVTLADGRVLAMSGLGEHGEDPFPDLEVV